MVLQVHYHRDGRVEKDRTRIGLYFAKKPVKQTIQVLVLGPKLRNPLDILLFRIPADNDHYVVNLYRSQLAGWLNNNG